MTVASSSQPQGQQQDPDALVRVGGSLFRQRTWLPLPIALALVLFPSHPLASPFLVWGGAGLVASGELLRLWAVRHIGVVSRTRSDRLGPLVATGPFARLRNPLYFGNIALWVGFAASAGLLWLIPPIVLLLALEYHAIVRWEEHLLEGRLGDNYREYAARVPRWLPLASPVSLSPQVSRLKFSWRDTFFSERGTLMAIVAGYLLLWYKSQV
jgi:protein-S-isoprenylcysteine O-methyltransferase Ste14